ncbi:MAG: response regulator [Candidatus Kryptoniota bacterium]
MPKLVLVADDNVDNISLIRAILKRSALDVEIVDVQTGREVLEFVAKRIPEIILLDMKMPDMDGYETAVALKSNDQTKHVPIIAVTAQAMIGDREKALEAGCCEYVMKPIDRTLLIDAIKKYLPNNNDD